MAKKKIISQPEGIPEQIIITDTLDLHGLFPEQIPEITEEFIHNAQDLGLERVTIVHGKGKSRLKFEVYQVLRNHSQILNFHDAQPGMGGWGSTIVELKVRRQKRKQEK